MIITESNFKMYSIHSYREEIAKSEHWQVLTAADSVETQEEFFAIPGDTIEISQEALAANKTNLSEDEIWELSLEDKTKLLTLQLLLEIFTGKKMNFFIPKSRSDREQLQQLRININNRRDASWAVQYDYKEAYHEEEKIAFSTCGTVKTADGKTININLDIKMSRSFTRQHHIHFQAGNPQLIDPLVINFAAPAASLTDTTFSFDLDADGQTEEISFLKSGSGFLALDLNSDGIINNGKELFGPATGTGFNELAKYDVDDNNWIDENDPIFKQLRIWAKDAEGNDELLALGQQGIGAIYLGHLDTEFSLKDNTNNLQGAITQTGVFLQENGTAGTIQELDLVV